MKAATGVGVTAALLLALARGAFPFPPAVDKILAVVWVVAGLGAFLYMWLAENRDEERNEPAPPR